MGRGGGGGTKQLGRVGVLGVGWGVTTTNQRHLHKLTKKQQQNLHILLNKKRKKEPHKQKRVHPCVTTTSLHQLDEEGERCVTHDIIVYLIYLSHTFKLKVVA